uniref:ABC transmembrane type-1 domain-containing protein n=1 Tax=Rhabditophanes sp. KR3021 TaxID=114890 RepID=A0AC35UD33_9BILA
MGCRKGKKADDGEEEQVKPLPKASLKQLWRYGKPFDLLLLGLGLIVSVVLGVALPALSIIIGNVTSSFIKAMTLEAGDINPSIKANFTETQKQFTWNMFENNILDQVYNYVIIGGVMFCAAFIQVLCFNVSCERVTLILKKKFLISTLRQDSAFFDKNTDSLTTKMFDNLERVKEGLGDKIGLLVQYLAQFIGGIIIVSLKGFEIMYCLGICLFLEIDAYYDGIDARYCLLRVSYPNVFKLNIRMDRFFISRLMATASRREAEQYAVSGRVAEESLSAIRTVTSFNGQQHEHNRYENSLIVAMKDGVKKGWIVGLGLGVTFFCVFTNYAISFWFATDFVYDGTIQPNDALGQAANQLTVLSTAQGAAAPIFDIIDRVPDIDSLGTGGVKPEAISGRIEIKNITFSYPTRPDVQVLNGISFDALPGETVALVGSSGSGKSTIVQLLLRYYNPDSGQILIDGHQIEDININYLRNIIGVVSQDAVVFNASIYDNVSCFDKSVSEADVINSLKQANAWEFVSKFPQQIHTMLGERGSQLSGGQKARICLACVIQKNCKIILLDEATSALQVFADMGIEGEEDKPKKRRLASVSSFNSKRSSIVSLSKNGAAADISSPDQFAQVDKDEKKGKKDDAKRLKKELKELGLKEGNFIQIMKFARPEWPLICIAVCFAACQGVIFPIFSQIFSEITKVFSETDKEKLKSDGHFWSLIFLAIGIMMGITNLGSSFFFGLASEKFTLRLRSALFKNIIGREIGYFDSQNHSTGKISARLATDATMIKNSVDAKLGQLVSAFVGLCTGVGIAFYFSWQLASLLIFIFPLIGISQGYRMRFISNKNAADNYETEEASKVALEAIENIKTVQALTLEKRLHQIFSAFLKASHDTAIKNSFLQAVLYATASSMVFFVNASAYRFSIWLVMKGYIVPLHVLKTIFAFTFTMQSLAFGSAYFGEYIKSKYAAGIIFATLGEKAVIESFTDEGKKIKLTGQIELRNLHFNYPERPSVKVLRGLDITIKAKSKVAFIGPSGCGKSTAIQLIERFYDPSEGQILLDGHDIRDLNIQSVRSQIALVGQQPILFDCSIRENLLYGLGKEVTHISDERINEVLKMCNIYDFVQSLPEGLETRVGNKGTQLSGGQKSRIAIATCVLREPSILALDEATSALDNESEKLVQDALDKVSQNITVVAIAHRLSTIANYDTIAVIKDGIIIEKGNHGELMNIRGLYHELTERQNMKE